MKNLLDHTGSQQPGFQESRTHSTNAGEKVTHSLWSEGVCEEEYLPVFGHIRVLPLFDSLQYVKVKAHRLGESCIFPALVMIGSIYMYLIRSLADAMLYLIYVLGITQ